VTVGDGAQVGTHPVVLNEVPLDEGGVSKELRVPIPDRYESAGSSGLQVDVKSSEDNVLNIELTTQEPKK